MPRISIPTKGLSSLAQAIMSGQDAAAQGFDEGMGAQAKTALAMQQIKSQQAAARAHDAEASLKGYQAQGEKASLDAIAPDALRNTAMIEQGIPLDDANAVDAYLKTGKLGGRYGVTGDDGVGPVLPLPDWAVTAKSKPISSDQFTDRQLDAGPASKLGSLARSLATMQQAIGLGDKSVENVAKAGAIKRTGSLSDAIINGGLARNTIAGAQAAIEGKPMFTSHEYGSSDNFTGAVDSSGPVAQTFKTYRDSETGKNKAQEGSAKASAAESYAGADLKKAQTKKVLQEVEQALAGGKGSLASPKEKSEAENKLRDEFNTQSKNYIAVRDSFGKLLAHSKDPNPASDIALIFAYMKILDPTSVVREGEFATAQNAASIPDRWRNLYNQTLNGTRLNAVQRNNLVGEGRKVYSQQETSLGETRKRYTDIANRYGLNPQNVVQEFAPLEPTSTDWGKPPAGGAGGKTPSGAGVTNW